jgi:glutamate N-acetyltransferase/amino-acid N-acetyltransferase
MTNANPVPLPVAGIRLSSAAADIHGEARDDLALVELSSDARTVGVFTRNKFCAAPVIIAQQNLAARSPKFLIFNAGNANAGTGANGLADAQSIVSEVARLTGCEDQEILPFSTGVIGERLPCSKILRELPSLVSSLHDDNWLAAAAAIMTTDLKAKHFSIQVTQDETTYTVSGMTKGSGMIHPNMATMLAFIATDADIDQSNLQAVLSKFVGTSFNRITVDGDTSTNDACILSATGAMSDGTPLSPRHPHWDAVIDGIGTIFDALAKSIVRDGEGATKFVEIDVDGASEQDNLSVAMTVAKSPLVKTALFASDPNWGRILAAIGRAPVEALRIDEVSIWLGDYQIVERGELVAAYDESVAAKIMEKPDIGLKIRLGTSGNVVRVWTCDFSYDYVRINAEYRS